MKKFIHSFVAIMATVVLVVTFFTITTTPASAQSICTAVTSEAQPQSGQKSRSSGNFSTEGCGTSKFLWTSPVGIVYKVAKDVSGGTDPVIFGAVTNGLVTNAYTSRSLYIADPQNANSSFLVTVTPTN